MARYTREYDPNETQRRIALDIQEANCPGLLQFLSTVPYGHEMATIRGIVYQWYLANDEQGTLEEALAAVLNGPGGRPDGRKPKEKAPTSTPQRRPASRQPRSEKQIAAPGEVARTDVIPTLRDRQALESPPYASAPRSVGEKSIPAAGMTPTPAVRATPAEVVTDAPAVMSLHQLAADASTPAGTSEESASGAGDGNPISESELEALVGLEKMLGL